VRDLDPHYVSLGSHESAWHLDRFSLFTQVTCVLNTHTHTHIHKERERGVGEKDAHYNTWQPLFLCTSSVSQLFCVYGCFWYPKCKCLVSSALWQCDFQNSSTNIAWISVVLLAYRRRQPDDDDDACEQLRRKL